MWCLLGRFSSRREVGLTCGGSFCVGEGKLPLQQRQPSIKKGWGLILGRGHVIGNVCVVELERLGARLCG